MVFITGLFGKTPHFPEQENKLCTRSHTMQTCKSLEDSNVGNDAEQSSHGKTLVRQGVMKQVVQWYVKGHTHNKHVSLHQTGASLGTGLEDRVVGWSGWSKYSSLDVFPT